MVTKDKIIKALDAFKENEFDAAIIIVQGKKETLSWINANVGQAIEMLVGSAAQCPDFGQILLALPFILKAALSKKEKENPELAIPTQSNPKKA